MRRITVVIFGTLMSLVGLLLGNAQAGLITNALSAWNDDNDKLTDYSWSVAQDLDSDGKADVILGLARIDRIQTDGHTEFDYTASKQVWLAFAFQVAGDVTSSDPYGSKFTGWTKHSAPSSTAYQLPTLLSNPSIPADAMFVLLELNSSPAAGSNLAKLEDGKFASETGAVIYDPSVPTPPKPNDAFDEIVALGFNWVGAFGILDPSKDFLYALLNPDAASEYFGLSLLAAGPGVNASDFKTLYPVLDPPKNIDETQYQFASQKAVQIFVNGNEFGDSGIAIVNYVPEPTSMAALAGLALTGFGGWLVRRRRTK